MESVLLGEEILDDVGQVGVEIEELLPVGFLAPLLGRAELADDLVEAAFAVALVFNVLSLLGGHGVFSSPSGARSLRLNRALKLDTEKACR